MTTARIATLAPTPAAAPQPVPPPVTVPAIAPPSGGLSPHARAIATAFGAPARSRGLVAGLARLFEYALLASLGAILATIHVREGLVASIGLYILPILVTPAVAVLFIQVAGGYRIPILRTAFAHLGRIFAAWTLVFAALAVTAFFLKISVEYSRIWFATWYFGGLIAMTLGRSLIAAYVRQGMRSGSLQRRTVIVGGGQVAADLIGAIEKERDADLKICGIFDDRGGTRSPDAVAGYQKLGNTAELVEFARIAHVDLLIVAFPLTAEARLLALLKTLWVLPVDIRLSVLNTKLRFRPRSYSYVGSIPFLDLFDKPIAGWDSFQKRVFDIVFASLAIVMLSPLMLAAAIAIKLDSKGPVLFRQKRYGFNNEVISVLKFRSMYHDKADATGRKSVTKGDPRVTRVGRFIRKTSIDELPQFFNVLKGELSLVGPRPHAPGSNTDEQLWDRVVDGYFARHRVKPGVTGWAQINGWRGEVDKPEKIQRRVDHDLEYIENWSVLFDLYILFLTPFRLFNQEGAY